MTTGGIGAPEEVEEGRSSPIELSAPGSKEVRITVLVTGEVIDVQVGADGKARFELPPGAIAGTTVVVADRHNPEDAAIITIVPASD